MPLYRYVCPRGHTTELWRAIAERDTTPLCVHQDEGSYGTLCAQEMKRVLGAPAIIMNPSGDGYVRDSKTGLDSRGREKSKKEI